MTKRKSEIKTSLAAIDWRSQFLDARSQQSCGSCWTFSTTGTLEGMLSIKKSDWNKKYLAPQQLVNCSRDGINNGCRGGDALTAFKYIQSTGIVAESTLPYANTQNACTINSSSTFAFSGIKDIFFCRYYNEANTQSYTNLQNGQKISAKLNNSSCQDIELYNLLKNGPASVGIDANVIVPYSGGIFDGACKDVNHAVIAVGYGVAPDGTEYFIVRNSWGTTWGENGYIKVKRNAKNNNSCFIANYFVQPQV